MRIGRRRMRSTQTPAGNVKAIQGRKRTTPRIPISTAPASRLTMATNGMASIVISSPNWLMVWPDHSFMKSPWRQRLGRRGVTAVASSACERSVLVGGSRDISARGLGHVRPVGDVEARDEAEGLPLPRRAVSEFLDQIIEQP